MEPSSRLARKPGTILLEWHGLAATHDVADILADKYGWQSSIAVCALVIILAMILRAVDVKYLKFVPHSALAVVYTANVSGQAEEKGSIGGRYKVGT